jgi:hypothetical protein
MFARAVPNQEAFGKREWYLRYLQTGQPQVPLRSEATAGVARGLKHLAVQSLNNNRLSWLGTARRGAQVLNRP